MTANYLVRKLSEGLALALLLSSTVNALAQTATATLSDRTGPDSDGHLIRWPDRQPRSALLSIRRNV
jgi:hypothetical protein